MLNNSGGIPILPSVAHKKGWTLGQTPWGGGCQNGWAEYPLKEVATPIRAVDEPADVLRFRSDWSATKGTNGEKSRTHGGHDSTLRALFFTQREQSRFPVS